MFPMADVFAVGLGIAVAAIGLIGTIIATTTSASASRRQAREGMRERTYRLSRESLTGV